MDNNEEQAKNLEKMSQNELKEYELKLNKMVKASKICRDLELSRRENNMKKLHQFILNSKAGFLEIDKLKSVVATLNRSKMILVSHNKVISNQLNYLQDKTIPGYIDPELSMDDTMDRQLDEDFKKWKEELNVENIKAKTTLAMQSKDFFVEEQEKVKQKIETVQKQNTELELQPSASVNLLEVVDDYNKYLKPNKDNQLKDFEGSVKKLENERDFSKNLLLMSQGFDTVDSTSYENEDTSDSELEI